MHYDFIEIGTADFDTLVEQDWPEDVRGICVEPRADLLSNLIDRVNVIKVNIINKKLRRKNVRGKIVKVKGYKKAIITLKKGQSIDLTTGI